MTEEEIKISEHEKRENMFKPGKGEIIKSAKVMKRNKWYFYQDRKLTLTNEPRLMYYTGDEYRGDIKLTPDLKTVLVSNDRFDLVN
jgi:PH domain